MTFVITLIALVIERFFHWNHLRHWRWFNLYQHKLSTWRIANGSSALVLAVCVLPLLLLVALINYFLGGWFYGIFKLVFGVLILLYCMGPSNLWVQTFRCLSELHKADPQIAVAEAQAAFNIPAPANFQAFHRALTNAIFIEANQRIFAVVFWFVLLGPVGAVLYRVISLSAQQSNLGTIQIATRAQRCLDWLPIRVLTLMFALGGHFTDVISIWTKEAKQGIAFNDKLLTDCGVAALDIRQKDQLPEDGAAEKAALELLDRAFVLGLVILAIIALIAR